VIGPQIFDQSIGGNESVGFQEEQGQSRALLGTTQWKWPVAIPYLDRPEYPVVALRHAHIPLSRRRLAKLAPAGLLI
jgi:hypothetical protein